MSNTPQAPPGQLLPWSADRPLDAALVAELVRDVAPHLAALPVAPLGAGWDNEAYAVGDAWVFRFPKRAAVIPTLQREIVTAPVIARHLTVAAPLFEIQGAPSERFPYPFTGYRRVPGTPVRDAWPPEGAWPGLARSLALALDQLAAVTGDLAPDALKIELIDPAEARGDALRILDAVTPLLGERTVEGWRSYCEASPAPPRWAQAPVFIHNDLFGDHILVDQDTWALTGLIDFADQVFGDPVMELVGIGAAFGLDFALEVADHVTAWALAARDRARLRDLLTVMPMRWAAHAALRGERDMVEEHAETVAAMMERPT